MSEQIYKVKLQDNNEIPVVGLGTWRLSGRECISVIRKAIDLGYTHFDTAEMYSNESDVGMAIRGCKRSELFITSKVWPNHLHYNDVITACESSLRKLGIDYLDLYLIHWPNESVSMKETLDAMYDLQKRELVISIGVSNFTITHLEKTLRVGLVNIVTNQVEFHTYLYQKELLEYCTTHNIILTAWAPLARGEILKEPVLIHIAKTYGKTTAQVALRWFLHKGLIAIPKASKEKHLKENIALFDWSLTEDDISSIDSIPEEKRLVDLSFDW